MPATSHSQTASETKFWVICRDDNPLAYQLARAINDWQIPGVRAKVGHQVPLAVSDAISQADYAIFVTAGDVCGEHVSVTPISCASVNAMAKAVQSPVSFLNTLRKRHGRVPQSWWFQLPKSETHQTELSAVPPEYILSKAVSKIEVFVRNHYLRHRAFQHIAEAKQPYAQSATVAA